MSRRLFYIDEQLVLNSEYTLKEDESKHIIKVLRYNIGDEIDLIDGLGNYASARIVDNTPKRCRVSVFECINDYGKQNYYIHLAVAPTKNINRYEWFIEKAVEIGVDEITPIICEHSERTKIKLERLEKVVVSAMKQSKKAFKPKLNDIVKLKEFVKTACNSEKFVAYCGEEDKTHLKDACSGSSNSLVLIGPEGDFSEKEIKVLKESDFKSISLGDSILRTETAAIVACNILNLENIC